MRAFIGSLGALAFAAGLGVIVGDAAHMYWLGDNALLSVLSVVFFPVTYVLWPWTHDAFGYPLWAFFFASLAGWWAFNFAGGVE
jgi:hypothetical protein